MSDPHAQMIEAALTAAYGNSPRKHALRNQMRRALAAAFRTWEPGALLRNLAGINEDWRLQIKAILNETAAELDGQSDGGQTA